MIYLPPNEYGLIIPSVADGTAPAGSVGTTVTPVQNSYGSYASVISGANVTHDVYGIWINIHRNNTTAAANDGIVTIGLDAAGGTSFTDTILHLLCSDAALWYINSGGGAGGVSYFFPLFIKAGTSIGAKASVGFAVTTETIRVQVQLYCKPSRPDMLKVGSFVQTFGAVTASSKGTAITTGTSSEGAWTELGTLDKTIWGWEHGHGCSDASVNANAMLTDLAVGDGSNKKIVCLGAYSLWGQNETIVKHAAFSWGVGVSGDKIYARTQIGPNAAQAGQTIAAYGIGG